MRKLPTDSRLGSALRSHRREKGLSQAALAAAAGLAEKTLRQLEQGRGNLDSWLAVLEQLGLELVGRNLPPGDSLGSSLASLRRRRRLGQRELAELVGVSQPTIVALEGQGGRRAARHARAGARDARGRGLPRPARAGQGVLHARRERLGQPRVGDAGGAARRTAYGLRPVRPRPLRPEAVADTGEGEEAPHGRGRRAVGAVAGDRIRQPALRPGPGPVGGQGTPRGRTRACEDGGGVAAGSARHGVLA